MLAAVAEMRYMVKEGWGGVNALLFLGAYSVITGKFPGLEG